MSTKQRIKQLEKAKRKNETLKIRVYLLDDDGGASGTDEHGNHVTYTAAEWEQHKRESKAAGVEVIHIPPPA